MEPIQIKKPEWERIFSSSPVNEDELPHGKWAWPKCTWFRKRLARVRAEEIERG
jgi:hypothetical protein